MIRRIQIGEYLKSEPLLPLIDVRTPAEFSAGHIPGAVNIPLFSNTERAEVGTVYTRISAEKAYELGFEIVRPKLPHFTVESKKVAVDHTVVVYCWRGGMRSKSFAKHIESEGIEQVFVLEGGYKAFRQYAMDAFRKPEIRIIGGYTGSGKTRVIRILDDMGEQVIDLEGIAHHKGSAFGAIGQSEQPPNEHFTNLLFWKWKELDMARKVWLEDESIHIGRVFIPEVLFQRMRNAQVYFLDIPKDKRASLLVEEYTGIDSSKLEDAITRISKRLGGLRTQEALEALRSGDFLTTAIITLDYYDKFYKKGLERRNPDTVRVLPSETIDEVANAKKLLDADSSGIAKKSIK